MEEEDLLSAAAISQLLFLSSDWRNLSVDPHMVPVEVFLLVLSSVSIIVKFRIYRDILLVGICINRDQDVIRS